MRTAKLLLSAIWIVGSAAAVAGPYCMVVSGMAPNCRFYDEASCAQAAVAAGGGCVAKKEGFGLDMSTAPREAKFCLVNGGDSKCGFYDAQSWAAAAKLNGGTCLTRPSRS